MKIINQTVQRRLRCAVATLIVFCSLKSVGAAPAPTPLPASNPILAADGWTRPSPPKQKGVEGRAGAYGANRIVYHIPGYGAVKGTFFIPDLGLGKLFLADRNRVEQTTDEHGEQITVITPVPGRNPNQNKPTLYLGAQSTTFFFDSGLQYEVLRKDNVDPGWAAVVQAKLYVNGEQDGKWYQSIREGSRPQLPKGQQVDMEASVDTNGPYNLSITAGDFSFPVEDANKKNPRTPNIYPNVTGAVNTSKMLMRRVVGMTQKEGETVYTDGSFLHNGKFTGGMVRQWKADGTLDDWQPWSTGQDPNHPVQGHVYSPRSYNEGHEHDGYEHGPIFQVNSRPPWNRIPDTIGEDRPDSPSPLGASHSRYYEESVDIDLLSKPVTVQTNSKKLGKSQPAH